MFNARNMRALLVVSVALFLLLSSVNMLPARSFLEDIINNSKRQKKECPNLKLRCYTEYDCLYFHGDYDCNGKLKVFFILISNLLLLFVI